MTISNYGKININNTHKLVIAKKNSYDFEEEEEEEEKTEAEADDNDQDYAD